MLFSDDDAECVLFLLTILPQRLDIVLFRVGVGLAHKNPLCEEYDKISGVVCCRRCRCIVCHATLKKQKGSTTGYLHRHVHASHSGIYAAVEADVKGGKSPSAAVASYVHAQRHAARKPGGVQNITKFFSTKSESAIVAVVAFVLWLVSTVTPANRVQDRTFSDISALHYDGRVINRMLVHRITGIATRGAVRAMRVNLRDAKAVSVVFDFLTTMRRKFLVMNVCAADKNTLELRTYTIGAVPFTGATTHDGIAEAVKKRSSAMIAADATTIAGVADHGSDVWAAAVAVGNGDGSSCHAHLASCCIEEAIGTPSKLGVAVDASRDLMAVFSLVSYLHKHRKLEATLTEGAEKELLYVAWQRWTSWFPVSSRSRCGCVRCWKRSSCRRGRTAILSCQRTSAWRRSGNAWTRTWLFSRRGLSPSR